MISNPVIFGSGGSGQTFTFTNDGKFRYPKDFVVPKNVTTFSSSLDSLSQHTEIESISFESGSALVSTGGNAFYNCTGLKRITFPASLKNIGNYAFNGCTGLSGLEIPAAVTDIGAGAFQNCKSLKNIIWSRGSDTVTLGRGAFQDSGITDNDVSVILNRDFTVYSDLFRGCLSLINVSVPMTWANMFTDCTNMKTVVVGNISGSGNLGDFVFSGCTSLTTAAIRSRNGGQTLGNGYFSNCTALKTVIFEGQMYSSTFASIGSYNPFYGCKALEDLQIPEGWTENLVLSNGTSYYTNVLTHDSMVAMIANLYDYSGGTAHTLTLGAANLARLSEEEIAVATAKNWTVT